MDQLMDKYRTDLTAKLKETQQSRDKEASEMALKIEGKEV